MQKYWIIGHPLKFCLTTPVMNGAFKALDVDAEFETHDITPEELPNVMKKLKNGELSGIVATMPFKTPSLEYLDETTEQVKAINSANLILNRDGKLKGYNTDWRGALGVVKEILPDLKGKKVLVLGAGGAARAACFALKLEGAAVSIWNRTSTRAKAFAADQGLEWIEHLDSWAGDPDIIINATAQSSQDRQSTLVPFRFWKRVKLALDAVYGKTSLFLEEAKAAHVPYAVSGEVWFLKQVEPMFELITGKKAPLDLMARLTDEAQEIQKM